MQDMIMKVIQSEIVRKGVHSGKKRGRKEDDTGSTTEEDIWEGNNLTHIREEEENSVEGNNNARNDHRVEEEEDAEDAEEGEGIPNRQKEYRGTGAIQACKEED
ncbi:hypothetical protein BGX38DRAFT_1280000 [Terfezia claveryi]|nr:hypothetical protein BGX38DRAFT_1280000 [Terfezia claveryi]